jgi:hypothetical protein
MLIGSLARDEYGCVVLALQPGVSETPDGRALEKVTLLKFYGSAESKGK